MWLESDPEQWRRIIGASPGPFLPRICRMKLKLSKKQLAEVLKGNLQAVVQSKGICPCCRNCWSCYRFRPGLCRNWRTADCPNTIEFGMANNCASLKTFLHLHESNERFCTTHTLPHVHPMLRPPQADRRPCPRIPADLEKEDRLLASRCHILQALSFGAPFPRLYPAGNKVVSFAVVTKCQPLFPVISRKKARMLCLYNQFPSLLLSRNYQQTHYLLRSIL